MAGLFASRLGLLAFAATALEAVFAGQDFAGSLKQALLRMIVFYALGFVLGLLATWLVEEQAQRDFENWKLAADEPAKAAETR